MLAKWKEDVIGNMKGLLIQLCSLITTGIYNITNKSLHCLRSTIFLSKFIGVKHNAVTLCQATIKSSHITISGLQNNVEIHGRLWRTGISINGNNNQIKISENAVLNSSQIIIRGNNCFLSIDKNTTFGSAYIVCMGEHNSITIGNECMFAENIEIWNTDSHPILDHHGKLLNPSKPIHIGNHVWCGKHSKILKGVTIGDNAIIGMQSIVTKNISPNTLNVGIPTKVIRENINWDRHFISE